MSYDEHACPHCDFSAKSAGGLSQHIDFKHKGVRKPAGAAVPSEEPKPGTIRCKVHRTNCAEENMMIPIIVNPCSAKLGGKKIFVPGEEVELTKAQYEILKDAKEPHDIIIPPDSGIYNAPDPLKSARANYPGYSIARDPNDGRLHATMSVPNYIIERV